MESLSWIYIDSAVSSPETVSLCLKQRNEVGVPHRPVLQDSYFTLIISTSHRYQFRLGLNKLSTYTALKMTAASLIVLTLLTLVLYQVITSIVSFRRNLAKAKASGITYVIVPIYWLQRWWLAAHPLFLPLLARLPDSWTFWVDFTLPDTPYDYRHHVYKSLGTDTFLTVSPAGIAMYTCDPGVISQITTRRNDFPKPTKIYTSLDIYGKNVVSTEGQMWRQHRKATAAQFTEANNHIVWSETIDQALKMVSSWVGEHKIVDRVMDDTMRLSLHVISRAGFGKKLDWPEEGAEEHVDQEYNDPSKIRNEQEGADEGHAMSYTYAIHCLLDNILFQFLLPRWMLENLPFKRLKKANEAYLEWGNYMKEAVQKKKNELAEGSEGGSMDLLGEMVKGQLVGKGARGTTPLTDSEVLGNMFVFILAGHETAANSIHFSMLFLAMDPKSQREVQKDIDTIFQGRPPSEWDYDRDLPQLFGGMVGAVMNEELRLLPPVIGIPKSTIGVADQQLTVDGKSCTVPRDIYITLATTAAHRNPQYWPSGKPTFPGGKTAHPISNIDNDLEEFRPQRWLVSEDNANGASTNGHAKEQMPTEKMADAEISVNESADTSEKLYKPVRGSYLPFSEGYRSCLGRRFAQVEILAAIAVIFQNYSVELAVDKYATDEELIKMDVNDRVETWQRAAEDARELILNGMGVIISLQMRKGHVKLRLVPRGKETFPDNVDELWKEKHPELCSEKGVPGWKSWRSPAVHGLRS